MLLSASRIVKSYGAVQALRAIDFTLERGEVHAVVGENGAGKSTLIKILSGAESADSGEIGIDGAHVAHNDPRTARALGIAVIYQQPALFPDLSVAENIALALERDGVWRTVKWKRRNARAAALLERTGARIDTKRRAGSLSMPEQQLVEIAKAIGAEAKIVIMDEPTASLTDSEAERLFQTIRALREKGAGVVYVSHRLEEVFSIADRITVLRDGETVATHATSQVTREEIVHMMVGREISGVYAKREVPLGEIALAVSGLSSREAGLQNVSFDVRKGEILGLAALTGSGRTELAEAIFGLRRLDAGTILLNGNPVAIQSPEQAIRVGIAYLPEDRRGHGVVLEMPITSNVSLASLAAVAPHGFIDNAVEEDLARSYIGRLRIKAESADSIANTLSGGNQQKVAISRWLATKPKVLILDEPTQGVDIGSKQEIHKIMGDLAAQGLAVILISSEMEEILALSDRIAVMRGGGLRGIVPRAEATPQRILSMAMGHG